MHRQQVTCAVKALRPHDWSGVGLALLAAEAQAKREGINDRYFQILTPDPEWLHATHEPFVSRAKRREIAVLGFGWVEKE